MGIFKLLARIFLIKVIIDRWRRDNAEGRPMPTRPAPRPKAAGSPSAPRPGEPGPDSPLELDAPDWKATLKRTIKEVKDDRIPLASAGMAFYFFLAIFPGLIAMVGIFNLFELDATGVVDAIKTNVPGGAGAVLTDALQSPNETSETASLIATIFGIGLALYSSSSGFVALQLGLNVAYDVKADRKFFGARSIALGLLIATGILGGVPSPFFTFGEDVVFKVIGWILTVAAVSTLFSIYYWLGPNRPERPRWRWVSVGGIVGTVLWLMASIGFGYYASNFGNYGKTYGTLSGVIILIFWLYLSALAVLIGGELNAELERQAAKTKTR